MSIRPIDFHVTYANTVNESKVKQNDFNRHKEVNSFVEHQQAVEYEKNKKKVVNTEATQEKKVKPDDRQRQHWQQGSKKKRDDREKDESLSKKGETKGLKIDIMI